MVYTLDNYIGLLKKRKNEIDEEIEYETVRAYPGIETIPLLSEHSTINTIIDDLCKIETKKEIKSFTYWDK